MSRGEFGTSGDGRGVELAREYLATHGPAAPHVNRLLEMDRDAVMEAAAERVCGPVGCPPGSVFDGKEDSLADAVHQAVAAALEKLEQLGYPVTFGPVPASPLADLPATLASVDDVAAVCRAAGLDADIESTWLRWIDEHHRGWYVREEIKGTTFQLVGPTWGVTVSIGSPVAALWHAIQAARSTS